MSEVCRCDPTHKYPSPGPWSGQVGWYCELHRAIPDDPTTSRIGLAVAASEPPARTAFVIKDSGERKQFASGSLRDVTTGKIDWSNVTHGPMLRRWAVHLTKAKSKYPDAAPGVPNWTLIKTDEELARYKESAFRHFMQWFSDERDEDHASAVFFNINGVEHIRAKREKV